jgi:hypothetical protein
MKGVAIFGVSGLHFKQLNLFPGVMGIGEWMCDVGRERRGSKSSNSSNRLRLDWETVQEQ